MLHNKDRVFPEDEGLAILVNWGDPFLTLLPSMLVLFLTPFALVSSLAPGINFFHCQLKVSMPEHVDRP